jgi:hypothetical protein
MIKVRLSCPGPPGLSLRRPGPGPHLTSFRPRSSGRKFTIFTGAPRDRRHEVASTRLLPVPFKVCGDPAFRQSVASR